jgi:cobalt/nickel transport system permease protein
MHIPDGFLDHKTSAGLMGAAAAILGFSFAKVASAVTALVPQRVLAAAGNALGNVQTAAKRVLTEDGEKKLRGMAVIAGWIFAAQTFNFPISSGTSGHLLGGVFAAVLLGPFEGATVIAAVLAVQAVFFGDGGKMALGANIINMAVIGALGGYALFSGFNRFLSKMNSAALAAWASVVIAAAACSMEIGYSGTIEFSKVFPAMVKTHCLIGIVEAFITVAALKYYEKRPL